MYGGCPMSVTNAGTISGSVSCPSETLSTTTVTQSKSGSQTMCSSDTCSSSSVYKTDWWVITSNMNNSKFSYSIDDKEFPDYTQYSIFKSSIYSYF